ncbi:hypothetical protein EVAR_13960_1 [Eumeta japonica]|uniref:Uncharacterized protein n=1 Tax=Eumeta variegata TaxID=151549 RepID=A0A4C1U8N4_EUMVA|nr:hypothetical protein EVAR_13960_1 [Eumeta japonica]
MASGRDLPPHALGVDKNTDCVASHSRPGRESLIFRRSRRRRDPPATKNHTAHDQPARSQLYFYDASSFRPRGHGKYSSSFVLNIDFAVSSNPGPALDFDLGLAFDLKCQ